MIYFKCIKYVQFKVQNNYKVDVQYEYIVKWVDKINIECMWYVILVIMV